MDNVVNIHKDVSLTRQMVQWYVPNVLEKGIQRNKPQNNWADVKDPEFTVKGAQTDLQNYCARTFKDRMDANDVVNMAAWILKASEEVGFLLRRVDEDFLEDTLIKIKYGKYDSMGKKAQANLSWRMMMVLLDQIDQNYFKGV